MKRYYIDTSVWGGYFDSEFSEWTKLLFEQASRGKFKFVYSQLTVNELKEAPKAVRDLLNNEILLPNSVRELVKSDTRSEILANAYLVLGAVSKKCSADAEHVAIATVNFVDAIISWNFKHMVNIDRIKSYNAINYKFGYQRIEIFEPRVILGL